MLKVEKYFNGSVADNIFEDDLTLRNYLALYCCVYGVRKKWRACISNFWKNANRV